MLENASMRLHGSSLKTAGWLIFAFSLQFSIVMIIAESIYPGYSVSSNYISDLGVGPTALLFDTSISVLGVAVIFAAYFMYRGFSSKLFSVLTALTGVGALSVGIFNESFATIHSLVSLETFVTGSLTAIIAYRFQKSPLSYFSVVLGIFSMGAIVISIAFRSGLGLGVGGIERMIVYPFLLWGIGFGGYLIGLAPDISSSGKENA